MGISSILTHGVGGCPQLPSVVVCVLHCCIGLTIIDSPPVLVGKEIQHDCIEIVLDGLCCPVVPALPIVHPPVLLPHQHLSHWLPDPQHQHHLLQHITQHCHPTVIFLIPIIDVPSCCVELLSLPFPVFPYYPTVQWAMLVGTNDYAKTPNPCSTSMQAASCQAANAFSLGEIGTEIVLTK